MVTRLSFDWRVRIALGLLVLAATLVLRTPEVSVLNHLLTGFGMWVLLVAAYEARALASAEYWYEFDVSQAKLSVFRVAFFSLVAFDAWRQTEHMARYGTNGFNVSHMPWLDAVLPMPSSSGILIVYLLQAYLAARVVLGIAVPISVKLLTALYGYSYFISQVDSYQHHYFVFLLLVISCFVPWQPQTARDDADKTPPGAQLVKTWAVRLLLVQMAVLYGWATMTKLDPLWLNGESIVPNLRSVEWMNYYARNLPGELYATPAQLAMVAEAILLLAVATRRLWFVAIPIGVGLHLSIELAEFEIGIFSYYMFGMYLLVVPDKAYQAAARLIESLSRGIGDSARALGDKLAGAGAVAWAIMGVCIVGGSALLWLTPFDEVGFVAVVASLVALSPLVTRRRPSALSLYSGAGHVVACAMIAVFFFATDTTHEMYKKLAGSHRRLGKHDQMYAAYAKLAVVSPDFGRSYHHMGHVHRRRSEEWTALAANQVRKGETDKAADSRRRADREMKRAEAKYAEALAAYKRTHDKDPGDYWAYLWEAILHEEAASRLLRKGKRAEARPLYRKAIEAAASALRLKPKKANVVRNSRRIIEQSRQAIQGNKPVKRRRRRRAPPRKSLPDP